jgi:hypothetical protein
MKGARNKPCFLFAAFLHMAGSVCGSRIYDFHRKGYDPNRLAVGKRLCDFHNSRLASITLSHLPMIWAKRFVQFLGFWDFEFGEWKCHVLINLM